MRSYLTYDHIIYFGGCDWCRTVDTTQRATNAISAHLVTMVTQHVEHLMIAVHVLVHSPHLPISMYDDFNFALWLI